MNFVDLEKEFAAAISSRYTRKNRDTIKKLYSALKYFLDFDPVISDISASKARELRILLGFKTTEPQIMRLAEKEGFETKPNTIYTDSDIYYICPYEYEKKLLGRTEPKIGGLKPARYILQTTELTEPIFQMLQTQNIQLF